MVVSEGIPPDGSVEEGRLSVIIAIMSGGSMGEMEGWGGCLVRDRLGGIG
jgi:hypothetical protein